ncbi:hypothetical protein AUC47_11805 [Microbacterium sp. SZ1]|uniref:Rossmann-like and DUF2520 domain-containing protein n=1 Tax=Microbacterium sp. SZ1 TaxID=1849736 RepID=UPI000BBBFDC9|nr:Rossmann-like and DUF2520 domain-containing protein [Microbacterium sp. SZ1]PCE15567.1 hypothetical protein AUC47_11805 [Microbacterium sp. SZ1]
MHSTPALPPHATIAIVGAGRLGGVLARALRAAGFIVIGPLRRDDTVPDADIALLCVPDSAIAAVAFAARPHSRLVAHVSGATPLIDVDFSLHPLQTFTGTESSDVFRGIGVAVDGRTPEGLEVAERLARALGANPFRVDDAHRAEYHAAASFASNFVLTVLDAAEHLAKDAGVDRAHLAPLVRQTVDNWTASGAASALTGPIVRGDEETVARQRAASADYRELFDALAAATRAIVERAPHGSATPEEPRA